METGGKVEEEREMERTNNTKIDTKWRKQIEDNTIVAHALMIAESRTEEKDTMVI